MRRVLRLEGSSRASDVFESDEGCPMRASPPRKTAATVLISNGFQRYPMAAHAAEMHRRGRLDRLITGAYPTGSVRRALRWSRQAQHRWLGRLVDRGEDLPDAGVVALWWPEALAQAAAALGRLSRRDRLASWLTARAQGWYGRAAVAHVRRSRAGLYHYRAGFGGASVEVARRRGMVTLVQYTLAHPRTLEYLVEHGGRFPPAEAPMAIEPLMRDVLSDVERGDHMITESVFVQDCFAHQGWDTSRIHVLEPGVDDGFLRVLPDRVHRPRGPLKLLFAGTFGRRKGADALVAALPRVRGEWKLDIVGPVEARSAGTLRSALSDRRVNYVGLVRRPELARWMALADVFVFPSLAEGSARVIWEAMAAGCYILTTRNSGSIVQHGVHGGIVVPDDADGLARAIEWAAEYPAEVARIGAENSALIRHSFTQTHYGARLEGLYDRLLSDAASTRVAS